MAAGRCSLCSINYPSHIRECQRCGGDTAYMSNAQIDTDWEIKSSAVLEAEESESEKKVYDWRLLSLLNAGAGQQHAEILARSKADLHKVCDALRDGCTPLRAVAIFGDD